MKAQGGMGMGRQVGERKRRPLERKDADCLASFKASGAHRYSRARRGVRAARLRRKEKLDIFRKKMLEGNKSLHSSHPSPQHT